MKKSPPRRGISYDLLSIVLIAMSIVLILAVVKIYLSNKIYYESRNINALEREVAALREENNILRTNVEKIKYKIKISDTIFSLDEDPLEKNEKPGEPD